MTYRALTACLTVAIAPFIVLLARGRHDLALTYAIAFVFGSLLGVLGVLLWLQREIED